MALMNVIVIAGGYLPGYRYGGPVRSLAALVDQLGDEIEFSVVTSGSEMGEADPYSGIQLDTWWRVGKADVWYTQHRRLSPWFWRRILADRKPDVVYLNSLMSPVTSAFLFWRKLGLLPNIPAIVAPRGELALSALGIKSTKKQAYRRFAELIRLHKEVIWQASSQAEANDIRREIGTGAQMMVAPDLVGNGRAANAPSATTRGTARFVWLGRIAPVKNLVGALEYLTHVSFGNASFTAYGPIEVDDYWSKVQAVVNRLPDSVTFTHGGELEHSRVEEALRDHHYFLFPTLGENFGHAIAEALSQGLPVIVSDQTPWRGLEAAGVGWDIPLNDTEKWTQVINHCIVMDDNEYQAMSAKCRGYVDIWMEEHGGREANRNMFLLAKGE